MKLYYHHVAQKGICDLHKTVFNSQSMSVIDSISEPKTRQSVKHSLSQIFPEGYFNVWGTPSGAEHVIKNLTNGDYVLLVESTRMDSPVPALCKVEFFFPNTPPELSRAFWGDEKYQFTFFTFERNNSRSVGGKC